MTSNKKQQLRQSFSLSLALLSFLSTLGLDIRSTIKTDSVISLNMSEVSAQSTKKVYYVSQTGSDSNPGTATQPWRNINYAVGTTSPVQPGDTILVQPGTYTGLVTLGKSGNATSGHITLKANGRVILRDPDPINGGFREGVIQSARKGYWIIDGFRIENTSWAGIALRDANNMIVQNNHTYQSGASGIIVMPETYYGGGEAEITSRNIKILRNTVERANWRWTSNRSTEGTQEALSIWGVDGFEVGYNTLKEGNREGIDAKVGSRNGSIHNNIVTRQALVSGTTNGYTGGPAIYLDGNRARMFNIDVHSNTVYGNTADAIVIADEVPQIGDVTSIRVYNNVIYGNGIQRVNGGVGILVGRNVSYVQIFNNTVAKNVQALVIDGYHFTGGYQPFQIIVRNNIFADSLFRNGYIAGASNLSVRNNLFTNKFANLYDIGAGVTSLWALNNNKVPSAGFVNLTGNDFRLSSISPAINTGFFRFFEFVQTV
ncbi:right-handed parallel beta-helix repeat-containing protein [Nostoc sp. UHCC 0870]|uniref:right-handed parallel beta-helix repeat-containing protein n=1 Tax=Nostoc sp. UHCC 0870 TaxID=2914041 RepID=UPI001EDDF594|nr:right-handed parallel beta-helix repeat-containing protein [Nostoc sp. UHCC 0870]UKP00258.1 right-handed parallel beta-helix repeat-containing protein [Nostoc sp. UHCC 0870]